jgi:hypothetical protein
MVALGYRRVGVFYMRLLQPAALKVFGPCAVILSLALGACATQPQMLWLKPGAASDDFGQDKYACMQQSQQPNSTAYLNRYGGVAPATSLQTAVFTMRA